MQSLLMATSLMFLVQSATAESPPRRAIELRVTIVGVDESVVVPENVASAAEFVAELRGNPGLRWSEEFRLHSLDNATAKCTTGNMQPIVTGYASSPFGRRPADPAAEKPAGDQGSFRPKPTVDNAGPRVSGRMPMTQMQLVGTAISMKPSIQPDGRLLITINLDSSRLDEIVKNGDPGNQPASPKSVTRKWSVKTSIVTKSGQAVLLTTSETDGASGVRAQTVLVVVSAEVEE